MKISSETKQNLPRPVEGAGIPEPPPASAGVPVRPAHPERERGEREGGEPA
jgi:hypothetical protein